MKLENRIKQGMIDIANAGLTIEDINKLLRFCRLKNKYNGQRTSNTKTS